MRRIKKATGAKEETRVVQILERKCSGTGDAVTGVNLALAFDLLPLLCVCAPRASAVEPRNTRIVYKLINLFKSLLIPKYL